MRYRLVVLLAFAFICSTPSFSLLADDLPVDIEKKAVSAKQEIFSVNTEAARGEKKLEELRQDLPKAENVDLKEVVPEVVGGDIKSIGPKASEPAPLQEVPAKPKQAEIAERSAIPSIQLLGAEVLPGTSTRLAWSAQNSLKGISVPTPVLVVHGEDSGPILCLTGAVHGDELNGIEVVRKVLYGLDPKRLKGTVIGVPIVNIQGFIRASRYLSDRRDLNRYFPGSPEGSSAARIAHSFFTQVIQRCDYLVDIHTGSFRRTNLPQLRADLLVPQVAEMTHKLGSIVVLHSHGAVGSLRRAAVEAGVVAVTIEAGEPLNVSLDAVEHGVKSIKNFMHKAEMYSLPLWMWASSTKPVYFSSLWVRASAGGILLSDIELGERVKEKQVLGVVTDPITNIATPILSPISGQVIGMALNQVMLPGFAAYHLGYQATVEEAATQDAGPDDYEGDDAEMDSEGSL